MKGGKEKQDYLLKVIERESMSTGTISLWWFFLCPYLYVDEAYIENGRAKKKTLPVFNNIQSFSLALKRLWERELIDRKKEKVKQNSHFRHDTYIYTKKTIK